VTREGHQEDYTEAKRYISEIKQRKTPYFRDISGIKIEKDVYPTGKIGNLFVRAIDGLKKDISQTTNIFDYGTGTGFLAVYMAKKGVSVVAIDKSKSSIDCAKNNAKLNHVEAKIDFRISDALSAIRSDEKFDIVLAGLPWEDGKANSPLESAFFDEGSAMRNALAEHAQQILKEHGCILISSSKRVENKTPAASFFADLHAKVLAEDEINGEPHYILGFFK
jgi:methylase of polypeptide subunit release factors